MIDLDFFMVLEWKAVCLAGHFGIFIVDMTYIYILESLNSKAHSNLFALVLYFV